MGGGTRGLMTEASEDQSGTQSRLIKKQSSEEYRLDLTQTKGEKAEEEAVDKKEMFEEFKRSQGKKMVQVIKQKVQLLKDLQAELNLCISTCNELKEKIDAKLKKVVSENRKKNKAATEEDYRLQMDIRRLKTEHEEFLGEYKRLKKQFRVEDKNLLGIKRELLAAFETKIKHTTSKVHQTKNLPVLNNMDSGEIVFMNAKERFQTIKKLKRMEKF